MANGMRVRRDWWKRGRALDLWSIPHFLLGVLTALLPPLLGASLVQALVLTLVFALSWELFERYAGIKETFLNGLADVLLPIVSFTGVSFLLRAYAFHPDELAVFMSATLTLYCYTNLSGWLAYRRRKREFRY